MKNPAASGREKNRLMLMPHVNNGVGDLNKFQIKTASIMVKIPSLPGESQGRRNLVGCHLWGRTESDTTEAT